MTRSLMMVQQLHIFNIFILEVFCCSTIDKENMRMSNDTISEIEKKRHRVILGQRMNRFVYVDLFRSKDRFLSRKGHILLLLYSSFVQFRLFAIGLTVAYVTQYISLTTSNTTDESCYLSMWSIRLR